MKNSVKILISVILIILLATGGFLLGLRFTEKIPLADPIRMTKITLNLEGVDSEKCMDLITKGNIPNRLVENLMLLCTPDDLLLSMDIEKVNSHTLLVEIPMEQEGNMIYFADELTWILQEECQRISETAVVTIADQQTLTITYEEQPHMTMAYVLAVLGAVLGILCGLLLVIFDKKKVNGAYSGM